ncbi:MAG: acetyl-CoA carboxylase biotin carboxyl carrier protein [Janthinobacterium lividum]
MNLELVEQIVVLLGEYPVSEIAVELEGSRVHVRKPLSSVPRVSASLVETSHADRPAESEIIPEPQPQVLTAPMVGIFYHAEPSLAFTAEVKPGQVVGYIESMKLMNDVAAEEGGRITDILVENGAPVEYGQALFRLAAL